MRVTGRVTDAFGTPLDGVNIFVKSNPQNGAITNAFGQFAFTMTSPGILVFSHVGKESYEVNPMNTISGNLGTIVLIDNFELEGVTVVGTPKSKKNTWLWWLLGGLAVLGVASQTKQGKQATKSLAKKVKL